MKTLEEFISNIEDFDKMKKSEMIDYFGLFYMDILEYSHFTPNDILQSFNELRIEPYSNIPQYLKKFSEKGKKQKFIIIGKGFHFVRNYDTELRNKIKLKEKSFLEFTIDTNSLEYSPNDIPLLNNKEKKNAYFFTKLYFLFYHLENSIRNFLKKRLLSLVGKNWENEIVLNVDLKKAEAIRNVTDLSEMMLERGDSILHYCMWDDYGKIIKHYPRIFNTQIETDEIVAHLSSMTKIRNGIAHNSSTIPKEYQEELNVFLKKYIKILNKY